MTIDAEEQVPSFLRWLIADVLDGISDAMMAAGAAVGAWLIAETLRAFF